MNKLGHFCMGAALLMNATAAAKDYNGAELYSTNTVKYGRFDVRMRTISGSGAISSFFLYYNNSYLGSPEPWQEIDIETLGKTNNVFQTNIITGNAANQTTSEQVHSFDNLSQNYHTYTVEWTPQYIAWLFDGVEVRHTTGAQVTACQVKDMTYRFNAWISSAAPWAGAFDPSILPVYQFINWIKYSTYTPGSGPNGTDFTPAWQDDFNTFDASRWAKGNWTFDGNLADLVPDNIVVKDGYCIICLTKSGQTGFTGDVPKDQNASIGNFNVVPNVKTPPMGYHNMNSGDLFWVSLNGRLTAKGSDFVNRNYSGLWIGKENNTVIREVKIAK